jgi:drug/metabolite transporter (DMT)-like permease
MNKSLLYINAAVFMWGFTGILGKMISFDAPILVAYRMLITCLILFAILLFQKKWVRYEKKDFINVIKVGALFAIHWVLFFQSIKLANASIAMLCLATASVFIALLQPLIKKTPFKIKEVLIGLIALIGVGCIYFIQPDKKANNGMVNFQLGVIYGVVAAIISAIFTIYNKPLSEKYPSQPTVFWEMTAGLVVLLIALPLVFPQSFANITLPSFTDFIYLLCLALFCTVIAQSLALKALKELDAFTVTLSINIEPIYGMIFAFVLFRENEQLNWGSYLGIAIILSSLALQIISTRLEKKKANKI